MKPELGEVSPDGHWKWDGTAWVPVKDGRQRSRFRRGAVALDLVLGHFVGPIVGLAVIALLILLGLILFGNR